MKKWLKFIVGVTLVAFSFNLFCVPDNLASTGVGGLSIVVNNFIAIDTSLFVGIINISLIILSYLSCYVKINQLYYFFNRFK